MPNIESASVVSMRRDRKGFKLEDESWYSSFNAISNVNMGDVVSFEYVKKGNFNNIKGPVSVTGGSASAPTSSGGNSNKGYSKRAGFPVATDDMGRAINRQSAIKAAIEGVKDTMTDANRHKLDVESYSDLVIDLARRFEAYTTGDLDTEIGKALAAQAEAEKDAEEAA